IVIAGRKRDAMKEFAALGIASFDDGAMLTTAHDSGISVEPQVRLVLGRSMASYAVAFEKRLNPGAVKRGEALFRRIHRAMARARHFQQSAQLQRHEFGEMVSAVRQLSSAIARKRNQGHRAHEHNCVKTGRSE